ncbi:MAG: tyrosine-type recombinase/integrase [Burkholderiaceae bacterium]
MPAKSVVIKGDPPLVQLMADYAGRHAATLRSPETARHHAARIGRWCEGFRASDTRQVVARVVQDMTGHYKPATINRSLGALSKALRQGWERGEVAQDYSGLIKRLPEHNARTTWLTLPEVQRLADAASEQVALAIWLSLLTGCRRGEVLSITPEMVKDDAIVFPTGGTKTMKARSVPIIAPLRPYLDRLPITINFEGVKSGIRRARIKADMPHVQYRDLRRSNGTLLIQAGVPLHIVSKILGHSSTAVTERVYAHLSSDQIQDGASALEKLHREFTLSRKKAA